MRPALLALSAIALLATGTAFSLQAMRPAAPSLPAIAVDVAASPPPAAKSDVDEHGGKATVPVNEATAATVVKVKTVRIDPEQPPPTATAVEQASTATEVRAPDTSMRADRPALAPANEDAARNAQTSEAEAVKAAPRRGRTRTARTKSPEVTAKRASRAKRRADQLAGDDVATDSLSYAPKEPGPESLNPLGKLLSGTR